MLAQSGMGLACRLAVESAGRTMIVFDLRKVVVLADRCIMKDRIDRCSS